MFVTLERNKFLVSFSSMLPILVAFLYVTLNAIEKGIIAYAF